MHEEWQDTARSCNPEVLMLVQTPMSMAQINYDVYGNYGGNSEADLVTRAQGFVNRSTRIWNPELLGFGNRIGQIYAQIVAAQL